MIRKQQKTDLGKIAEIWLDTNLKAHSFIPAAYWMENLETVKEMLPCAEVYVYEDEASRELRGFIGLQGGYIAGIFVSRTAQSHGIGKQLLDYAKGRKDRLDLNVYRKNTRAIRFYKREGFQIQRESIDANTGEKEYLMRWNAQENK